MGEKSRAAVCAVLLSGIMCVCGSPRAFTARAIPAAPGPEQELLPDESAAKAKQILQQVIAVLGGQAFVNVRDTECEGRAAQFGSSGDLVSSTPFRDDWLLPDKDRTEYLAKGQHNILAYLMHADDLSITHGGALITVFNGVEGWQLDKGGVTNQPEDVVKSFTEEVKSGMNNMLRSRLNEPGVEVRYGGQDIVDLKEAEWIYFTDRDHRDLRLAVEKSTHLPLRWVVATRDAETGERTEVATTYTQFLPVEGVKTPMSLERLRNGRKVSQTFLTSCKYNSNLDPQLFTRAALEQRASQITKKGYKDAKNAN